VSVQHSALLDLGALVLSARSQHGSASLARRDGDEFVFDALSLDTYEVSSEPAGVGPQPRAELTRDGQVAELVVRLAEPETLSGWVLDEAGQGVPDVWVSASVHDSQYADWRPAAPVLSDAQGAFVLLGLLPGRYDIAAKGGGGEAQLEAVPSGGSGVRLRLQAYGSVSGSVTNAAGEPVSDFVVSYRALASGVGANLSGSRGAWSLPRLVPGNYRLAVSAARGTAETTFAIAAGREQRLALTLASAPEERSE
jgi:hypothetical protein